MLLLCFLQYGLMRHNDGSRNSRRNHKETGNSRKNHKEKLYQLSLIKIFILISHCSIKWAKLKKIMNKFCRGTSQIRVALWTLFHGTK